MSRSGSKENCNLSRIQLNGNHRLSASVILERCQHNVGGVVQSASLGTVEYCGRFLPVWLQTNSCAAMCFLADPNNAGARHVVSGDVVRPFRTITAMGVSPWEPEHRTGDFVGTQFTIASATPAISQNGVVSATGFGGVTSMAPGSRIEIYGSNLAKDTRGRRAQNGVTEPNSLDRTCVTIGGKLASLTTSAPAKVNALVPSDVPTGLQQLRVTTGVGTSVPYNITVGGMPATVLYSGLAPG